MPTTKEIPMPIHEPAGTSWRSLMARIVAAALPALVVGCVVFAYPQPPPSPSGQVTQIAPRLPDHDLSRFTAPPKSQLHQYGSWWVERVETFDPEGPTDGRGTVHHYDFIWREWRTVRGKVEFRLARIIDQTERKTP
jgi:hypothetical protein